MRAVPPLGADAAPVVPDEDGGWDDRSALDFDLALAVARGASDDAESFWARSPAKLLHDHPYALAQLGEGDLSWLCVARSAGALPPQRSEPMPLGWRALYAAGPGNRLRGAPPASDGVDSDFVTVTLGVSAFVCAAALGRLLDLAASSPLYTAADGKQRDLRDALPVLVARVLNAHEHRDLDLEVRDASLATERALLGFVLRRITRTGATELDACAVWTIVRWLSVVLVGAPTSLGSMHTITGWIDGLDRDVLPAAHEDALAPMHFTATDEPVSLASFAWMEAIVGHHLRMRTLGREPWSCPPMQRWLREEAARQSTPHERAMEQSLSEGHNACGWEAPHIAPPLVARWVLTRARVPWLDAASVEALDECVALLRETPRRCAWLCSAALHASKDLSMSARNALASVWRDAKTDDIPAHLLATLAVSLVEVMEAGDLERLREQFRAALPSWMPFVLDALLDASVRSSRTDVGVLAENEMRSWIVREDAETSIRVNASVLLAQRARSLPWVDGAEFSKWFLTATAKAPLRDNLAVRREIQRIDVRRGGVSRS